MSKGILFVNMPTSCSSCNFSETKTVRYMYGEDDERYCKLLGYCVEYTQKDKRCPIKEIPEKQSEADEKDDYEFGIQIGWNACLDKILGENK